MPDFKDVLMIYQLVSAFCLLSALECEICSDRQMDVWVWSADTVLITPLDPKINGVWCFVHACLIHHVPGYQGQKKMQPFMESVNSFVNLIASNYSLTGRKDSIHKHSAFLNYAPPHFYYLVATEIHISVYYFKHSLLLWRAILFYKSSFKTSQDSKWYEILWDKSQEQAKSWEALISEI